MYEKIKNIMNKQEQEIFEKNLNEAWSDYCNSGSSTVDALEDNPMYLAFCKGFYKGYFRKEKAIEEKFNEPKNVYYEQMIIDAKNHNDFLYHNDCKMVKRPDIYSIILDNSEKEVNLVINYETTISEEVTNNQKFINSIENFLNKPDTTLRIIITHSSKDRVTDNNFYKLLLNHPHVIYRFSENKYFKRIVNESTDEIEFCTGDESMFNICIVNKQYDMTNFNDKEMVKSMVEKFKEAIV